MEEYNKLVRDKIPEIIKQSGKECEVVELSDADYMDALVQKLEEELDEYHESGEISELADMVEVIYALVEAGGLRRDEFEAIRLAKKEARGGFERKVLLKWVR